VAAELQQLLAQLPKEMGETSGGRDRFELERMARATATMPTNAELLAAVSDIVETIDCLIFLPRPKTLQ
jgi:hypothetical protein